MIDSRDAPREEWGVGLVYAQPCTSLMNIYKGDVCGFFAFCGTSIFFWINRYIISTTIRLQDEIHVIHEADLSNIRYYSIVSLLSISENFVIGLNSKSI